MSVTALNGVQEIAEIDAQHIWHPYAEPGQFNYPVRATNGAFIELEDGRTLIDAMSSWWSAVHGHGHPRLVRAAKNQIERFSHVMFGGLTHRPAAELTRNLLDLTGGEFTHVFYSDSGSVSVEVAMKMALQYARGINAPRANQVFDLARRLPRRHLCGDERVRPARRHARAVVGSACTAGLCSGSPLPGAPAEDYLELIDSLVGKDVAAIIVEPLVQGAGGMRFHDPSLLRGLRKICDSHGIVLIADEIATGFGRTGHLFATLDNGVVPDIMCVGKALTGGFMTLAATLATRKVAHTMQPSALLHGPTFMANPLACAVAAESTAMIAAGSWRGQVRTIERGLKEGLAPLINQPGVADVRVKGAIGVVEMREDAPLREATEAAMGHGVWIRPFGRLLYTMPPYICGEEEVARICRALGAAAEVAAR